MRHLYEKGIYVLNCIGYTCMQQEDCCSICSMTSPLSTTIPAFLPGDTMLSPVIWMSPGNWTGWTGIWDCTSKTRSKSACPKSRPNGKENLKNCQQGHNSVPAAAFFTTTFPATAS